MSSILDTANNLLDLKNEFKISLEIEFPKLDDIRTVAKQLEQKTNGQVSVPGFFDIRQLRDSVSMNFRKNGKLLNLSYKESKNLPFILNGISDTKLVENVLYEIQNNDSIAMLKREIYIYFSEYCDSYYISRIAEDISKKLKNFSGKNKYLSLLKNSNYLFTINGKKEVLQNCLRFGFFEYFKGLKFPNALLASKYVVDILEKLYKDDSLDFPLDKQLELFKNIYHDSTTAKIFISVIPVMIGRLIIEVDKCNRSDKNLLKEELRIVALKELGEPRIKRTNKSGWLLAGDIAKAIFIRWISQYDLDLFFKIINDSIPRYETDARRMWLARENFWKSYKKNISMVWVCFGYAARRRVRNDDIYYGKFYGNGDDNKSCIIIEIGDYIFVERSHNGKVKVWHKNKCPFPIGVGEIQEGYITGSYCIEEWVHQYSSNPSNKPWQNKVGDFIKRYCGIPKPSHLW